RAHAAGAESAKSHLTGGQMDDGIVDAASAEPAVSHDLSGIGPVSGEVIQGQRMWETVDLSDCFFQRMPGDDRKDRTDDLLLHDGILEAYISKNSRRDLQSIRVRAAAADDLFPVNEAGKPSEMFLVDDLSVVRVVERIRAKLPYDLFFDLFCQRAADA